MEKLTPAARSSATMALLTFWLRSSKEPAQPTQYRYSPTPSLPASGHVQVLGPVGPVLVADAPGVGVLLDVAAGELGLGGEVALVEHQAAAHVDDLVDVLVLHRALLLAGVAGGAGPDLILGEDVADELLLLGLDLETVSLRRPHDAVDLVASLPGSP